MYDASSKSGYNSAGSKVNLKTNDYLLKILLGRRFSADSHLTRALQVVPNSSNSSSVDSCIVSDLVGSVDDCPGMVPCLDPVFVLCLLKDPVSPNPPASFTSC